jgi:hypothetical protein
MTSLKPDFSKLENPSQPGTAKYVVYGLWCSHR